MKKKQMQMLTKEEWKFLSGQVRSKLISKYDSTTMVPQPDFVLQHNHKGFYAGLIGADAKQIARSGFMSEGLRDIFESANTCTASLFDELKDKGVSLDKIHPSTICLTIIVDCQFMPNPLDWNEEVDGVYFQWGQKYSGLYLPYQIKRMNLPKIEVLDRLVSYEAGLASNLWRCPEGLCYKLLCETYCS